MLSGREIIQQRLSGPRELPTCGWKDFCPTNSWLEQKQIQTSLENKEAIISLERVEKQTNLARAEWILERNKARVLKKIGKYWEVVGHHQDNEDWLFPEEALYLIELNVLELFHDGVPVSVEHAYALLLGDSRSCTLQEYRVYSYLSRSGYKLIRHSKEVTAVSKGKQISLDQVLESQSSKALGETSQTIIDCSESGNNSSSDTATVEQITKRIGASDFEDTNDRSVSTCGYPEVTIEQTSERNSETEDVYLVEDNIEIIEIDDCVKKIQMKTSNEQQMPSKDIIKGYVIVIDDEADNEQELTKFIKQQADSPVEESDDDVVLIKTVRLETRAWYKPLKDCLVPNVVQVVDLCNDGVFDLKIEKDGSYNPGFDLLKNKTVQDILDEMINASNGIAIIKAPNSILLPQVILPKHSEYKVNLNVRQETNNYNRGSRPALRQFYNNASNNYFNGQRNNSYGNNVFVQASEMKAMALTMLQVASSLMTAFHGNQNTSSINNIPLVNDIQHHLFNRMQYQNNYTPRHFNNGGGYNYNYRPFRNRDNSYSARNNSQRRNYKVRAPWNNNSRLHNSIERKQNNNRSYNKFTNNSSEVADIDLDDNTVGQRNVGQHKRKNRVDVLKSLSKRCKQTFEVIDLCDDVPSIKNEPLECEVFVEDRKFNMVDVKEKPSDKNTIDEHDFKTNKEQKQELPILGEKLELHQHLPMHLERKVGPDDRQNINNERSQKYSETEMNEINSQLQIDTIIKEISNTKVGMPEDASHSPSCITELESNESLETTHHNDSNAEIEGSTNKSNKRTDSDSDDNSIDQQKRKKRVDILKNNSKKFKQTVEVIDLCDDVTSIKSEPLECEVFVEERKFNMANLEKPSEKIPINKHNFRTNKKQKQELSILGKELELHHHLPMHLERKERPDDRQNINNMGSQKYSETEMNEINSQRQIDPIIKEKSNEKVRMLEDANLSLSCITELESNESVETTHHIDSNAEIEVTTNKSNEREELPDMTQPTSWQQFKEQTEESGNSDGTVINKQIEALIHPDHCEDLDSVLANLQIFGSIDEEVNERSRILKISFDVYLPTDHFKKTVKVLPKFRVIVVKSTDPLPAKIDIDILKTNYQDGVPFIYAIVYDETITFYFYDMVSLPK